MIAPIVGYREVFNQSHIFRDNKFWLYIIWFTFVKFLWLRSWGKVKVQHDIPWFCRLNYSIIRERWSFQPTQFRVTESEVPVSGYDIRKKSLKFQNFFKFNICTNFKRYKFTDILVHRALEVVHVPILLILKDFSTQFSCQLLIALRF